MAKQSSASPAVISLPQGGGALRGIGETFAPDLHSGTGNFTVPIAMPSGRNGFQPSLNLAYSTGNGNGPFGLGWSLSVPGVSRKTSKGVPRYDDRDVFLLSGAEDLVPVERDGTITRYQPRTEGLFARIRHIQTAGNDYWEVCSKDGLISLYGTPGVGNADPAVVADFEPLHQQKIFAWQLTETRDSFGNRIEYSYLPDAGNTQSHRWNQPLLHQIRYVDYEEGGAQRFLVSVTFDYESRPDPFSDYRSTFEIRTTLRCRSITIATHADVERVQRVYHLVYLDQRELEGFALPYNGVSLLNQIWVEGRDESSSELLANPAFVTVGPLGTATSQPVGTGGGDSAATRWTTWRNRPSTLSTQLEPSAFSPAGEQMIHVSTDGIWGGLVQLFGNPGSGPSTTIASAWIFVRRGRVGIGAGDGGNTSIDAVTQTTGTWEYLSVAGHAPANEFAIYAASEGGAEYYVASASVSVTPRSEWLPPLEFGYSVFAPEEQRFFPVTGPAMPPSSLAGPGYDLIDLTGDGLPDIVEIDGAVRYWRNLGGGRFDLPRPMRQAPFGVALADTGVQLIDVDGDGRVDLLVSNESGTGCYPLSFEGEWDRRGYRPFGVAPSFSLEDSEVRLVDLDGDGVTDVVRSGTRLECFFGDPNKGWDETRWVERGPLHRFPNVSFADSRVKWADMTGDGLQDIVLVYERNVEYWPNLGCGSWGGRLHMRNGPTLPFGFDPRRVLLGDVDGDGLADLVYVEDTKVTLWINQSGNGWSAPVVIEGTPPVSDIDALRLVDLLGGGVAGLLWSRDVGQSRHTMYFLDFTGGAKPYLLNTMNNHLGALTQVGYAPSSRFFLADRNNSATRWRTTLPFPVQVVERVDVIDAISGGKLTSRFAYHHGYWDGVEREFRGFGLVDRFDSEDFGTDNGGDPRFAPPTKTRTWFHLGPVADAEGEWAPLQLQGHWDGDQPLFDQRGTLAPLMASLPNRRARRDALRALRGSVLRTELYALDGSELSDRPYTVTEALYSLRDETPAGTPATLTHIFFPHLLAQRITRWERGKDPLRRFSYQSGYNAVGLPTQSVDVACPRGWPAVSERSDAYLATFTFTRYASIGEDGPYIHDRPAVITTYGYAPAQGATHTLDELTSLTSASLHLEILGQTLHFYDGAFGAQDTLPYVGLPLGMIGQFGALVRTLSLVLTPEILVQAYGAAPPLYLLADSLAWPGDYPAGFRTLTARAGYVELARPDRPGELGLYTQAERRRYDFHDPSNWQANGDPVEPLNRNRRGLVMASRDPLHNAETTIAYDTYGLLPVKVTDQIALITEASYDFRVLQPARVIDANGNETEYRFSPQGLLRETWVRGKPAAGEGDQQRPSVRMEYDFFAFRRGAAQNPPNLAPIVVRTIRHAHHDTELDVPLPERDATVETREYSDGFGRLIQTRAQAEDRIWVAAGGAPDLRFGNDLLPLVQPQVGGDVVGVASADPRRPWVVVSGWQVYDNKGRVIEKFEPYFAAGWDYAPPTDAHLAQSASVQMRYDALGRVVQTTNPDGSLQIVVYGVPTLDQPEDPPTPTPWERYTYDANDNAGRTHPAVRNSSSSHQDTPASVTLDALGRVVQSVERNGPDPATDWYTTRTIYDLRGNALTVADPLGRIAFSFTYDLANRPLHTISIDAGERWMVYDAAGGLLERRDGRGGLVLSSYDLLNRPARVWARDATGLPMTLRQELEYGDSGDPQQPLAQRDANRTLNRLGKPARQRDEAGELVLSAYDFKGNVLERARATIADAPILAAMAGAGAGQPPVYRVDWSQPPALDLPHRTTMAYDALGRLKWMQLPNDVETPLSGPRRNIRPRYNRAGTLEGVALDGDTYVAQIAYNARGQRTLVAYGNGVLARYAYDPSTFRLARLRSESFTAPAAHTYRPTGTVIQDFAYSYDLAGNILGIADQAPGCGLLADPDSFDREFAYDPIYRLLSANGREHDSRPADPWDASPRGNDLTLARRYTQTYTYDAAGNFERIGNSTGSARIFTLSQGTNRLQSVSYGQIPFAYTYDENGNLTGESASRRFGWDYADRLVGFAETAGGGPSKLACYLYDADGERVKKLWRNQQGHVQTTVYIDGVFEYRRLDQGNLSFEQNIIHLMDNQSRVATVRVGRAFPDDGAANMPVQYHLGDHLGSSNVVGGADARGHTFISREEHYPYGETSFGGYGSKRYRFTGKERDEDSGLCYHGARYYAPWLGRWVSCDPAGMVDEINLYSYVSNNPVRYIDPFGLSKDEQAPPTICYEPEVARDAEGRYTLHIHSRSSNVIHMTKPAEQPSSGDRGGEPQPTEQKPSQSEDGSPRLPETGQIGSLLTAAGLVLAQAGSDAGKTTSILWTGKNALAGGLEMAQKVPGVFRSLESSLIYKPSSFISNPILKLTNGAQWAKTVLYHTLWKAVSFVYGFHAGIKGHKLLKLIQTDLTIPKYGLGSILRNIEAPAYRLGRALIAPAKALGRGLPIIGGVLSGVGLAQDIQNGDVSSGVGNALGVAASAASVVGAGSAAAVLSAGATGYAIGSVLNEHLIEPLIDKAAPGSGALGDWYYRTFLK